MPLESTTPSEFKAAVVTDIKGPYERHWPCLLQLVVSTNNVYVWINELSRGNNCTQGAVWVAVAVG